MYEVELKVRANHEEVRARLERVDGTSTCAIEQEDIYFSAPHRDFAARDEALRLRTETDTTDSRTILTYKGPRLAGDSKVRVEHETAVESVEETRALLDALGFEPAVTVEKHREYYDLDSFTVALDAVTDLGEFVEIETTVEESELERARTSVAEKVAELGLDPDAAIRDSYLELLLTQGNVESTE